MASDQRDEGDEGRTCERAGRDTPPRDERQRADEDGKPSESRERVSLSEQLQSANLGVVRRRLDLFSQSDYAFGGG